jgi:predicted ATPase
VTGPGGVGKTRLAVQAAADLLPSSPDGAWLCELAAAGDRESMAQVVATALWVRSRPGLSTAGSVVEFLRTRGGLVLVLDNCEHLIAAAAPPWTATSTASLQEKTIGFETPEESAEAAESMLAA